MSNHLFRHGGDSPIVLNLSSGDDDSDNEEEEEEEQQHAVVSAFGGGGDAPSLLVLDSSVFTNDQASTASIITTVARNPRQPPRAPVATSPPTVREDTATDADKRDKIHPDRTVENGYTNNRPPSAPKRAVSAESLDTSEPGEMVMDDMDMPMATPDMAAPPAVAAASRSVVSNDDHPDELLRWKMSQMNNSQDDADDRNVAVNVAQMEPNNNSNIQDQIWDERMFPKKTNSVAKGATTNIVADESTQDDSFANMADDSNNNNEESIGKMPPPTRSDANERNQLDDDEKMEAKIESNYDIVDNDYEIMVSDTMDATTKNSTMNHLQNRNEFDDRQNNELMGEESLPIKSQYSDPPGEVNYATDDSRMEVDEASDEAVEMEPDMKDSPMPENGEANSMVGGEEAGMNLDEENSKPAAKMAPGDDEVPGQSQESAPGNGGVPASEYINGEVDASPEIQQQPPEEQPAPPPESPKPEPAYDDYMIRMIQRQKQKEANEAFSRKAAAPVVAEIEAETWEVPLEDGMQAKPWEDDRRMPRQDFSEIKGKSWKENRNNMPRDDFSVLELPTRDAESIIASNPAPIRPSKKGSVKHPMNMVKEEEPVPKPTNKKLPRPTPKPVEKNLPRPTPKPITPADSWVKRWQGTDEQPLGMKIQISIMTPSGKAAPLDVVSNDTISVVKSKIHEKARISPARQRLLFAGHQLEDHFTLSHYNIQHGSTIHLATPTQPVKPMASQPSKKTAPNPQTPASEPGREKVPADMTREEPGQSSSAKRSKPTEDDMHRPVGAVPSKPWEDSREEQGQSGKIKITVKSITGKTVDLHVAPFDKVSSLKAMIEEKDGIPADQQRLIWNGQELDDERTALGYNIPTGATLFLSNKGRGGGAPATKKIVETQEPSSPPPRSGPIPVKPWEAVEPLPRRRSSVKRSKPMEDDRHLQIVTVPQPRDASKPMEDNIEMKQRTVPVAPPPRQSNSGLRIAIDWFRKNELPNDSWVYLNKSTEKALSNLTAIPMIETNPSSKDEKRVFVQKSTDWLRRHNPKTGNLDDGDVQLITDFHEKVQKLAETRRPSQSQPKPQPKPSRPPPPPRDPSTPIEDDAPAPPSSCCVIL